MVRHFVPPSRSCSIRFTSAMCANNKSQDVTTLSGETLEDGDEQSLKPQQQPSYLPPFAGPEAMLGHNAPVVEGFAKPSMARWPCCDAHFEVYPTVTAIKCPGDEGKQPSDSARQTDKIFTT